VLSATNQRSLPKLCCLQWTSVRCRKCVVSNESVFVAELCCLQRMSFCCRIVLLAVNQCSLPNYVIWSESVFIAELWRLQRISFHCRIMLSVTNQLLYRIVVPAVEQFRYQIMVSQRISLLVILCFSESVCQWVYITANQFVVESVLQRISSLTSCVAANQFVNEFVFRQINFADESMSSILLTNCMSPANRFRCQILRH
jgi:hypothetical protein